MSKTIPILVLFVISLYGYRIEGHLFDNTDETRLQGVTVKLYKDANADALPDDGDTFISSTVSDENGTFLFDEQNGTYFLVVDSRTIEGYPQIWME